MAFSKALANQRAVYDARVLALEQDLGERGSQLEQVVQWATTRHAEFCDANRELQEQVSDVPSLHESHNASYLDPQTCNIP